MSQAEELLNSMTDGGMVYATGPATEPHIIIGADRYIIVPQELKRLGVQYDHNIETVTFDCPRYWDGHDMSKMKIYINFIRADKEPGSYPIDGGVTIDTADSNIMHFDWTISREVTEEKGNIIFLVCVKSVDDEGNEHEHWNSELCKDCFISEGLEVLTAIINKYPDVITHLLTRMDLVEKKTTLSAMLGYLDTYFTTDAKINEVLKNYVTGWLSDDPEAQAYIAKVVNDYIYEHLGSTDPTLTIIGGMADAAATGDAVRNMVNVTNELSVNDSVAGVLKVNNLFGRSEQRKTSGKNLVKSYFATGKHIGVILHTLSANMTYTFSFNGNAPAAIYARQGALVENGDPSNGTSVGYVYNSNILTFTITEGGEYHIQVYYDPSAPDISTITKVQVEVGSGVTTYEPYTGAIPSPNPEYPQEIKSAGDGGVIAGKVVGKNLLNLINGKSGSGDGVTYTNRGDGTYTAVGTATAEYGNVWFAGGYNITPKNDNSNVIMTLKAGKTYYIEQCRLFSGTTQSAQGVFTPSEDFKVTGVRNGYQTPGSTLNYVVYPRVFEGSEDLGWSPYTESNILIPIKEGFRGIPVTDASLANYVDPDGQMWCCDYVDVEKKVLVQRVGELDNSSCTKGDTDSSNNGHGYVWTVSDVYKVDNISLMCTHYRQENEYVYFVKGNYISTKEASIGKIYIASTDFTTLEEFKAGTEGMIIRYPLATPIETPLTDEQLAALKGIPSCNGATHISFEGVAPGVKYEYPRTLAASHILENTQAVDDLQNPFREVVIEDEEVVTLDDCAAGGMKVVDMFGKSVQDKTSGKNLLNINAVSNGLLDHNTGMPNHDASWLTTDFIEVTEKEVTASVNNKSNNFIVRFCEYDSNKVFLKYTMNICGVEGNASRTITLQDETKYVRVTFGFNNRTVSQESYIASGNVIQLEYGSEVTDYEPYTNGPSPNPEYEQPIVSAGQKLAEGWQLLDLSNFTEQMNAGVTVSKNNDGTLEIYGTSTVDSGVFVLGDGFTGSNVVLSLPAGNYTVSGVPDGLMVFLYKAGVEIASATVIIINNEMVSNGSFTLSENTDFTSVSLRFYGNTTFNASGVKIMLNEGSTAKPWEPYTGGVKKAYDVGIRKKLTGKNYWTYGDIRKTSDSGIGMYIPKGTYTFSSSLSKPNFVIRFYYNKNQNDNDSVLVRLSDNETFVLEKDVHAINYNNPENLVITNIQLEYGPVATEYEPYTEQTLTLNRVLRGIPVTDASLANYTDKNGQMWCADEIDMDREIYVGNLFKPDMAAKTVSGVTFTVNTDGTVVGNGIANALIMLSLQDVCKVNTDGSYILSGCPSGGSQNGYRLDVRCDSNTLGTDVGHGITLELNSTKDYVVLLRIGNGTVCDNLTFKPMIRPVEIDGIPTSAEYVPYSNGKFTKKRGVLVERVGMEILEFFDVQNVLTNTHELRAWRPANSYVGNGDGNLMSNKAVRLTGALTTWDLDRTGIMSYAGTAFDFIAIRTPLDITSLEADIAYILATPILKALTDEEIIALNQLRTNLGITHIYGDNNPAPATRLKYAISEIGGLTLENSNLRVVNDVLIAKNENLLNELNEAIPFSVVIDDAAGTINFIDRVRT